MSRQDRKINGILDKLEKSAHLSVDGREWLISACDPFHDYDLTLSGYPDLLTASTVVQLVKQQFQVTVPTGVSSPNNWDASIVMFPHLVQQQYTTPSSVSATGTFTAGSAGTGFDTGGVSVAAGPQGGQLWPNSTTQPVNVTYSSLTPNLYVKGQGRIIAQGFEVVNTTADISKQGQVTAWRLPSSWTDSTIFNVVGTTPPAPTAITYKALRMPPGNIADAQLLFGSRSWAARDGAYVVSKFNSESNPAQLPIIFPTAYTVGDFNSGSATTIWQASTSPAFSGTGANFSDYYIPFDMSGVHFSGLSYATTLTINARWFIERVPGPSESDLVVLASKSSDYDPLALELYKKCMADMPPGCMLAENFLGEWFTDALQKVADFAPQIGTALGNIIPGAQLVGKIVGTGAGAAANLNRSSEAKKKTTREANKNRIQHPLKVPTADSKSHPVNASQSM